MKVGFIFVLFHTSENEIKRLQNEIANLNFSDEKVYFIDNSQNNTGFAGGVNSGIKKALLDKCEIVIIANPDITFNTNSNIILSEKNLSVASENFDIWGYAMKQRNEYYYGGEIASMRMSGGLSKVKPDQRFSSCDFVSGSLMCIKTSVFEKAGFFDERYFMYYEDVEFCLRAKKYGFAIGIDSEVIYEHFESSDQNPDKNTYLFRNRILFLFQYGNIKQKLFEIIRIPKTLYEERRVLFRLFTKDTFFLNFVSLNVSSFIHKMLFFILFIFLFRQLGVNQYGIYSLVWAHTSILSPLVDLGTTSYGIIYSPNETERQITSLISLRTSLAIIVFIITILISFLFGYDGRIIQYIIFTSVIILSNAMSGSFLIISSLKGTAYIPSLVSFIFNLILVITQVLLLISYRSLNGIFLSIFIFYCAYTLVNAMLIKKILPGVKFFRIEIIKWIEIASKSYIFVLIGLFAGLYYKIDLFLLNFMKGQAEVGIYSAGYKFLEAFLFLPATYNMTATPIFARLRKSSITLLKQRVKRDTVLLTTVGFIVSLLVFFIAPVILPLVMNKSIGNSTSVLKIVIFALPFTLISSVFFNTLYVLNKAKFVVVMFAVQTVVITLLNVILIPYYSYTASAYITVLSEAVNLIILMTAVSFYLKRI